MMLPQRRPRTIITPIPHTLTPPADMLLLYLRLSSALTPYVFSQIRQLRDSVMFNFNFITIPILLLVVILDPTFQ